MGYYSDITDRSQRLIRRFATRDPFHIAKELGIITIYSDELNRLKGMYRIIKRNRFIILNSKNSASLNRIVCAHEIGHDQLHREYAKTHPIQEFMLYDMASKQEYEANIFAAELLLADDCMIEYINMGYDAVQIASAMETDINLVALKTDCLIRNGYSLRKRTMIQNF